MILPQQNEMKFTMKNLMTAESAQLAEAVSLSYLHRRNFPQETP